jgi:hypothetical protein
MLTSSVPVFRQASARRSPKGTSETGEADETPSGVHASAPQEGLVVVTGWRAKWSPPASSRATR